MVGCRRKILLLLFALKSEAATPGPLSAGQPAHLPQTRGDTSRAQNRVGVDSVEDHLQLTSATDDEHSAVSRQARAQRSISRKGASAKGNVSGILTSLPNETISASVLLPHAEWPPEPDEQEHAMSSMQQVTMVLAVGSGYVMHISPLCAVRAMRKRGSVFGRDSGPFVALACGCFHWTLYGLLRFLRTQKTRFLVIFIGNGPGSLLGTYYTIIYWLSCDEEESLRDLKRFLCAAVTMVAFESVAMSIQPARQALKFLGFVSSMLSSVVYISTLSTARTVLRTRSVASMPTDLVVTSFLSNILWSLIGLQLADPFMIFTAAFGIFLAFVGLGLTVRFHERTRWLWEPKGTFTNVRELDDWTSGVFLRTPLNLEE